MSDINTSFAFFEDFKPHFAELLELAKKDDNYEFEVRMRSKTPEGKITPGVPLENYLELKNQDDFPLGKIFSNSLSMNVTYPENLRLTDYLDKNFKVLKRVWVRKSNLKNVDNDNYLYRVSVSSEKKEKEPNKEYLETTTPSWFRLKERTTYVYKMFKIDITKTKQGKTYEEVMKKSDSESSYEVEIEYIAKKGKHPDTKVSLKCLAEVMYSILCILNGGSQFIISEEEKSQVREKYSKLFNSHPYRLIGSQPFSLTRKTLPYLQQGKYSVTEKTDGQRCLLFIDDKGNCYFLTDKATIYTGLKTAAFKNMILDGELTSGCKLFLAFDYYCAPLGEMKPKNHPERLQVCKKVIESFFKEEKETKVEARVKEFLFPGDLDLSQNAISIYSRTARKNKSTSTSTSTSNKIDGLIFTPIDKEYFTKTPKDPSCLTYKWKPPVENTIDFHCKYMGDAFNSEYRVYHLRVATTNDYKSKTIEGKCEYQPEKDLIYYNNKPIKLFAPSKRPLAFETYIHKSYPLKIQGDSIVEFNYIYDRNLNKYCFLPLRIRWDKMASKKGPNFEKTADDVWETIINPIKLEELSSTPVQVKRKDLLTIQERKNSDVLGLRNFHNWIKKIYISKFAKSSNYILDLASGKGGDIMKYPPGVSVLGFDIDSVSVQEARKRVSSLRPSSLFNYYSLDLGSELIGDFYTKHPRIKKVQYDLINCQFAIHFFLKNSSTCETFFRNVSDNLKQGGYMIGSTFDGERVYKFLKEKGIKSGESYKCSTFEIKKTFPDHKEFSDLEFTGQAINVRFGNDTVMSQETTEYLVNFKKMNEYIKKFGLKVTKVTAFEDIYPEWMSKKRGDLSEDEKVYSFFNSVFIIEKKQAEPGNKQPQAQPHPADAPVTQEELPKTRKELVEIAKKLNIKNISKKNMKALSDEIKKIK